LKEPKSPVVPSLPDEFPKIVAKWNYRLYDSCQHVYDDVEWNDQH
jgi:hypothetical protein